MEEAPGSNFLNLEELYGVHKKKDVNKIEVYRRIYQKCQDKIKKTNDQLGKMECQFEVPTFLWGTPIYDYDDLKSYIIYRLRENGITHCYFMDQNNLYVSWRPEHIDKKRYRSAKRKYGAEEQIISRSSTASDRATMAAASRLLDTEDSSGWASSVHSYAPSGQQSSTAGKSKSKSKKKGQVEGPDPSGTMKFGSQFEVPVNMEKIRMVSGPRHRVKDDRSFKPPGRLAAEDEFLPRGSDFVEGMDDLDELDELDDLEIHPVRRERPRKPPSRHLLTGWHNYFSRMRGGGNRAPTGRGRGSWANPYL